MQTRGILDWHGWSRIRKSQVFAAVIGLLLAVCTALLLSITGPHKPFDVLALFAGLVMELPRLILEVLGLNTIFYTSDKGWSVTTFTLIILTNSFLYFFLVTGIGWILKPHRNRKTKGS